ncbi:TPA: hypothetical protein ROX87_003922 [Bacillus thuringiensis]|nr:MULTISPECIES: hypothetical protein [Bacillus]EJS58521.1 hypothetical protein ICE_01930 [Bacillus cereus BAG1X1-2]EPF12163.1 hypothetical protein ICA_02214 [Bacillus cereus BAG1O-3]MCP1398680.1 hypothetical protein [Bacillus cereus]MCU4722123.1 hypothetical protein [Bacillus cereus]MCU4955552.1 hypothetical protein [Bacillus cereus]
MNFVQPIRDPEQIQQLKEYCMYISNVCEVFIYNQKEHAYKRALGQER